MRDPHPGVREHAIRVSEALLHSGQGQALGEALNRLVDDPEIRVRRQLAFSLGEWNSPVAGTLLARLTNRAAGEPELQTAIASSAVGHSVPILNQLFSGPLDTENLRLMEIMLRLAAIEADDEELKKLLRRLVNTPAGLEPWRVEALSALLSGARTRQLPLDTPFADPAFRQALHAMATNAKATPDGRVAALRLLCRLPDEPGKIERLLTGQLTAQSPRELFDFSITELAKRCLLYTSPSPRDGLLSRMPSSA